jgi:predicted O-methyltransferase YrrM
VIDTRARAVMTRLERQDAAERERGTARAERLRQITPDVGRFLHTLVLARRPRTIVEAGTSGGYSTIWLATAARRAGGTVTTLEIDPVKIAAASANLRDAGVDDVATIVQGDAFAWLRARQEPIDFFFLDAEKEDYLAYFDLIVPLLPPGGVLVADNMLSHARELAPFQERAMRDPRLSAVVVPVGRGELLAARIGVLRHHARQVAADGR